MITSWTLLFNLILALILVSVMTILAARADQRAWSKDGCNLAWRRLQQKIVLGKAHCR